MHTTCSSLPHLLRAYTKRLHLSIQFDVEVAASND